MIDIYPPNNHTRTRRRQGFTLIELLLALALVVVATVLIGSLMQLYARDFATRGEDIRRQQLARSILSMIADDIRAVVLPQDYDPKVLEQLLAGSASQGGGGGGAGEAGGYGADDGSDSAAGYGSEGYGSGGYGAASGELATMISMPPGIYGTETELMVDVSRIPRPDEYNVQVQMNLAELQDVPGDMKTVTYFVQAPTEQGVQDDMGFLDVNNATQSTASINAGLVRRQLDRAIVSYAEEVGDSARLLQTGDLVAPEVLGLQFSFFDGTQWLQQWDSSQQGLPWLVQISLAMQSGRGELTEKLLPGIQLGVFSLADRQAYGVEVHQIVVAIPGAQLTAGAASAEQAAGMESLGM